MRIAPKINKFLTPRLMHESSAIPTTAHAAHPRPDTSTSLIHARLLISFAQHPRSRCGRYHNALLRNLQDGTTSGVGVTKSPFFSNSTSSLTFLLVVYSKNSYHSYTMHEYRLGKVLPSKKGRR